MQKAALDRATKKRAHSVSLSFKVCERVIAGSAPRERHAANATAYAVTVLRSVFVFIVWDRSRPDAAAAPREWRELLGALFCVGCPKPRLPPYLCGSVTAAEKICRYREYRP